MTIKEIVRAAAQEHMTYGEYVHKYNPPGDEKTFRRPERTCARCGADISNGSRYAKYCLECAKARARERNVQYYAGIKAKKD